MADNVAITAGTGTAIHADEYTHSTLGSGKTQLVKLVDGTLDSSTAIAAGGGVEAGALRVTIASDSTGVLSIDDNGGIITVDGTVTANLSATDNAVLDAIEVDTTSIDAKIPALGQALAAASVPVVLTAAQVTTLTPPAAITGFGTAANQSTIIGHLDGVEGLLTTIDGDTGTIATEVAGLLTDTELRATPVPVSGTVTANIGTVATLATAAKQDTLDTSVNTLLKPASTLAGVTTVTTVSAVTAITNALPAGTNTIGAVKSVPSDIDINGSNANHADKYYTSAGPVTDGIIWSPAAGKRWHVLNLTINVSAACTVTIEDDLAAGDNPRLKFEFAANSGITIPYDKEHPFSSGEDAADLIITTSAGNVYVQAVGYEI